MKPLFFQPEKTYRFKVDSSLYLEETPNTHPPAPDDSIIISVDETGTTAHLSIIPHEQSKNQEESSSYHDCDIHGPTIFWISNPIAIVAILYRHRQGQHNKRLVGLYHTKDTGFPTGSWVAVDEPDLFPKSPEECTDWIDEPVA
jgi:hypothetical protein